MTTAAHSGAKRLVTTTSGSPRADRRSPMRWLSRTAAHIGTETPCSEGACGTWNVCGSTEVAPAMIHVTRRRWQSGQSGAADDHDEQRGERAVAAQGAVADLLTGDQRHGRRLPRWRWPLPTLVLANPYIIKGRRRPPCWRSLRGDPVDGPLAERRRRPAARRTQHSAFSQVEQVRSSTTSTVPGSFGNFTALNALIHPARNLVGALARGQPRPRRSRRRRRTTK